MVSIRSVASALAVAASLVLAGCGGSEETPPTENFRVQPQAQAFGDCTAMQAYLQSTAATQQRLAAEFSDRALGAPVPVTDGAADASVSAPEAGGAGAVAAGPDSFTGTNNQEAGVDEADIVKIDPDGDHLYLLSGNQLVVVAAWPAAATRQLASTEIEGQPQALFVDERLAWVVSTVYDDLQPPVLGDALSFAPVSPRVKVTLVDLTDRSAPRLVREIYLDGFYQTARLVEGRAYLALASGYALPAEPLPLAGGGTVAAAAEAGDQLPRVEDRRHLPGGTEQRSAPLVDCNRVFRPDTPNGTGLFTLLSFDLQDPQADFGATAILSNGGVVYASPQALYVAAIEDGYWLWLPVAEGDSFPQPGTSVHRFTYGPLPTNVGSGRVPGQVLNQFSMSEYQGHLRVATTVDAWWRNRDPDNGVFVLDVSGGDLTLSGQVTGLGKPGERIFSARFQNERGYLVTFRRIDPLYTLDLADPANPVAVGELEVPGFSTYLHPLDGDRLLAIGRSETNRLQLSLFDVADFANPTRLDRIEAPGEGYSEAEHNHLAFTYYPELSLLAIPVVEWSAFASLVGPESRVFNGLRLFRVGAAQLEAAGSLDHGEFYRDDRNAWWYYPQAIRRSLFIGSEAQGHFLYALSPRGLSVSAADQPESFLATVKLPGDDPQIWYAF